MEGLGVALRGLRDRPAGGKGCGINLGLAVWGLMFGGLPLLMGLQEPGLLVVQLLVLVAACLATFFFWERIRELFSNTGVILTTLGGVFFVAGCLAAGLLLKQSDYLMALLFGLLFGGFGGAMIYLGLRMTLFPPAE